MLTNTHILRLTPASYQCSNEVIIYLSYAVHDQQLNKIEKVANNYRWYVFEEIEGDQIQLTNIMVGSRLHVI